MVEKVRGKILGYGVQHNMLTYYYVLVLEKDTGDKITIRSQDAYPVDSYQVFEPTSLPI